MFSELKKNLCSRRGILLAGCALTLLYAFFSHGYYHHDEHFQILEYACMKLFGTPTSDHLAWEFSLMMRSGMQPFIVWCLGRVLLALGVYSPYLLIFVLQLLCGAFSVAALLVFGRAVRDELGDERQERIYLALGLLLWFLAYLHVHFSAEMMAGNMLLLLAAATLRYLSSDARHEFRWGLLLGALAGATFVVRYQTGFALLGYGLWLLLFRRRWKLYAGMVPGVAVLLAFGLLTDRWLYGEWTLTPVNYLRENILNGHMLKFGVEPWWYYFTASLAESGVLFGLLVWAAMLRYFWRQRRSVVTWMLVPFLLVHFFMGHKEIRFFFPVLFFAPYFITLFFRDLLPHTSPRLFRWVAGFMAAFNVGALLFVVAQDPADFYFYRMMTRYCRDRGEVVGLNVSSEKSYYSWPQYVLEPQVIETRFYMPRNMDLRHFATFGELESAAQELCGGGRQVLLFSPDPALAEKCALPLRKIVWSPYPTWVVRHFNFNDWTRYSVRSKNVYEVLIAESRDPDRL
ncbi:hypothetical protein [uncultured Alistipes sp.]|uniref:hypothetical protein n=1 Tax=uncultured Alistipes sp. TaxID=538949 RepID=UPI002597ABD3|nr:hypothetical protein [uncultured Alistipes sp.]